jgi:hypothetical protein
MARATDGGQLEFLPDFILNPRTPIERRFLRFHAHNPRVFDELRARAVALHKAGRRRIGIALIFEAMRYSALVDTTGEPFKLDNSFRSLYARLLVAFYPELEQLIELRARKERAA